MKSMLKSIILGLLLCLNTYADGPVIFNGSTAKWLPSGLHSAGVCQLDANGVMTVGSASSIGVIPATPSTIPLRDTTGSIRVASVIVGDGTATSASIQSSTQTALGAGINIAAGGGTSKAVYLISGGTAYLTVDAYTGLGNPYIAFGARALVNDGSVTQPQFSWLNAGSSGLYRAASNDFRFTVGGVDKAGWTASGLTMYGTISGAITHAAATTTTPYTVTWPSAQGGVSSYLSNDGSGVLSWASSATPTLTNTHIFVGNGANVASDVALSGDVSITSAGVTTVSNASVIAKVLTGYSSSAGAVSATDSILQAIQKLNGNGALVSGAATSVTSSSVSASNGASLSSNVLTLTYADGTYPGLLSPIAQSIAGVKTFLSTISGSINGNAATATALASNPTDCGSNVYATAIDASGNLTCSSITNASTTATPLATAGTIVSRDGQNNFAVTTITATTVTASLTGNASTATALAADPADCSANTYATAINASGTLSCSAVSAASGLTGQVAIANGGTGQASATAGFNALSPNTTSGDITIFDGSNNVRLARSSTDGDSLITDHTVTPGVAWSNATTSSVTTDINWALAYKHPNGYIYTKTITGSTTFTFSNKVAGQGIQVTLHNTGNFTASWPSGIRWSAGTTPSITTGSITTVLTFLYDGIYTIGNATTNLF